MTLQEVTDKIIEELYNRKITTTVQLSKFCKEIGLIFNQEMRHVSQELETDGYVNVTLFEDGDGLIRLNNKGINYIENKQNKREQKINHILDLENEDKINQDGSEIDAKENDDNNESQNISNETHKKTKEEKINRILSVIFEQKNHEERNLKYILKRDIPKYFKDYNEIGLYLKNLRIEILYIKI